MRDRGVSSFWIVWGSCQKKQLPEGTYKTKHTEATRLDYTTTHRHIDTNMNKDRPASTLKLGHARVCGSLLMVRQGCD